MKWKELIKIGVSGSRNFPNTDLVTQYLDKYIRDKYKQTENIILITGGARGVDCAVETYCRRRGIKFLCIPARWLELDKVAGPRRNEHIVNLSSELIAFWYKKSPGTGDTIARARTKGIPVQVLTVKKLRLALEIPQVEQIIIPRKVVKKRDVKNLLDLIREADMGDYFTQNKEEE